MLNDGATRWSKKFKDRFSRFDTIPAVTDSHPASQPANHVAVAITLNAKASSLKKIEPIVAKFGTCSFLETFWTTIDFISKSSKVTVIRLEDRCPSECVSTPRA